MSKYTPEMLKSQIEIKGKREKKHKFLEKLGMKWGKKCVSPNFRKGIPMVKCTKIPNIKLRTTLLLSRNNCIAWVALFE